MAKSYTFRHKYDRPLTSIKGPWIVEGPDGYYSEFENRTDAAFTAKQLNEGSRSPSKSRMFPGHHATKKTAKTAKTSNLFMGVFPTGISYADRTRERHGDYLKLAFLPYSTLKLEWYEPEAKVPRKLRAAILADARRMATQQGQEFPISAAGQTVTLGSKKSPAHSTLKKAPTKKLRVGGTAIFVGSNAGPIRTGDQVRIIRIIGTAARIIPASATATSKQAMRAAFERGGIGVNTDFLIPD